VKRVCLLTGAGGRLGQAFCSLHADRYAIAAVHGRRRPPEGPDVLPIEADLTRPEHLERAVQAALDRFGRVDLIVNAAVRYVLEPALDEATLSSLQAQFEVNVFAPLRLVAAVARAGWQGREADNRAQNRSVVNVSSLSGTNVYEGRGQAAYAASKAALDMLTRHLASELKPLGVRCNAVAPNAFPRLVSTEAVAAAIARLDASDANGQVLILDRGGERLA
jgi:NAD(P)-dependent dehydrogenase (short-subunit alcohol dehydrogenase family)